MRPKITDEIRELLSQSVNWAKLEIEYLKLTAAEKLIILISMMVIGIVVLILLLPAILMFLFALAQVFIGFMPIAVAYVCVGGIVLLCLGILVLFRKQLVINPVAKFISKVLLDNPRSKRLSNKK
ncbi:MAG: phage holin family protein [Muribaculaceae bacterium]|nr:phage holin family protein [Muribaculaceae bacterium]